MCVQVDTQWSCGHVGFYKVKFCDKLFKECKGTSVNHEVIHRKEVCSDCKRRETLPDWSAK